MFDSKAGTNVVKDRLWADICNKKRGASGPLFLWGERSKKHGISNFDVTGICSIPKEACVLSCFWLWIIVGGKVKLDAVW